MIQKITVKKYRKIKDLEFKFDRGINILSGTNGTCKTSLLHIASNSFQRVNKKCDWVNDKRCLDVFRNINSVINPKMESLTRGDEKYNNPALDLKGELYSCQYYDGKVLNFRRHNSRNTNLKNRFSLKPYYGKGKKDELPILPIIYLGLSRLYAFGEYKNDDKIEIINKNLPQECIDEIAGIYKEFTGINISSYKQQKMGDIKKRAEFSSDIKGIDSNTISAGEDNLFIIITALVSLKYYYNNINSFRDVESMLLIDEVDASLHPNYQNKLLELFEEYGRLYKIQYIFTTHSISLLEYSLEKKNNVIYLLDNIDSVVIMDDVDKYKIKMYLGTKLSKDIYASRVIPVFTEDNEARLFMSCLFDFYEEKYKSKFINVRRFFHFVDANISSSNLTNIFEDNKLLRSTMRSICVLDGDQKSKKDYSNHIITLPGTKSPEELIFEYCETLFCNNSDFWLNKTIQNLGYTKIYYRDNIMTAIKGIDKKIKAAKEKNESTKGMRREENKKVFNKYKRFFELVLIKWINTPDNNEIIQNFYLDLKILFRKVSEFHEISSKEWED